MRVGLFFGVGLGCLAAAPSAAAGKLEGAAQLSLDGSLVTYESLSTTPDPSSQFQSSGDSTRTVSLGLLGSGFGVGLAYAVAENALVGVQLHLSDTSSSGGEGDTAIDFLPRVEYMFDGDNVRPFLTGMVGISHASDSPDAFRTTSGTCSAGASACTSF
jgi:hypothetical protein